jgi:hypothetical protein
MAKDRAKVPTINISNQKAGMAYGGVIYSSDVTVGYNAEATKLNINAVLDTKLSKTRDFLINKNTLDLTSPVNINISDSKLFRNMFLTSYSKNTQVDSKVLNLTYSDGSVLLDRIFVGMIHEHFQVDKRKHMVPNMVSFDVFCPQIEFTQTGPVCSQDGTILYKDVRVMKNLASPTGVPGRPYRIFRQNKNNIWEGGYIVLGSEEFSEVECDLKDVSYGFEDFINALRDRKNGFGINIDLSRYIMTPDSNLLQRSYTGTVKDVLQNWGNDLGISYYWDFTLDYPTLVIISNADRSVDYKVETTANAISALDSGQEGGTSSSGLSDIVINSKSENVNLDGTFSQAFSSTFNVGPRAKQDSKRKTSKVVFNCETIESIIGTGAIKGRSARDVKTSCALGKYSSDLRDIWNVRKAIKKHMAKGLDEARGYYEAVGFSDVIAVNFDTKDPVGEKLAEDLKAHIYDTAHVTQLISQHNAFGGTVEEITEQLKGYKVFLAIFDDSLKDLSKSIESEISDGFIGRHYTLGAPRSELFDFNGAAKVQITSETKPASDYYSLNQHYKTPMAKFAKKIEDLRLNRSVEDNEVYKNHLYTETKKLEFDALNECNNKKTEKSLYKDAYKRGFYHFERDAPWATFQEDVDNLLNPFKLCSRGFFDSDDDSPKIAYYKDTVRQRVKTSLLKEYLPFQGEPPLLSGIGTELPAKVQHMKLEGEKTDKKFVIVLVKGEDADGKMKEEKIGDILLGFNFKDYDLSLVGSSTLTPSQRKAKARAQNQTTGGCRNTIEEINALRSLCDRQTSAMSDMAAELKTVCERDFVEELCSSKVFGQSDKTCGEAQAIADSLYDVELQTDKRSGSSSQEGIYADCITLTRVNRDVGVELAYDQKLVRQGKPPANFGKSGKANTDSLYADVKVATKEQDTNDKVKIIYPSENNHNGVILYNRETTITDLGVRQVFDPINGSQIPIAKTASAVKYQVKDITQDITSVINEDNKQKIAEGEIPINIVANVEGVTDSDGGLTYTQLQNMSAIAYHNRLKGNLVDLQVVEPRKSYNFTLFVDSVGGLQSLLNYLKPENGLESLSISMSEGGFSISISLSNRASADIELEKIYRKVGPVSREMGSKFATLRSL